MKKSRQVEAEVGTEDHGGAASDVTGETRVTMDLGKIFTVISRIIPRLPMTHALFLELSTCARVSKASPTLVTDDKQVCWLSAIASDMYLGANVYARQCTQVRQRRENIGLCHILLTASSEHTLKIPPTEHVEVLCQRSIAHYMLPRNLDRQVAHSIHLIHFPHPPPRLENSSQPSALLSLSRFQNSIIYHSLRIDLVLTFSRRATQSASFTRASAC